jgi:DNA-binding LytR/AlgR family response regulator
MNRLKCVIIDDEDASIEILTNYINKTPYLQLLRSFTNPNEGLLFFHHNKVDLFFLDIIMPEFNGLTLAKLFQRKSKIILITAHRDYACDGFNLNVLDYLLKPIPYERFLQATQKYTSSKITVSKNDFMFVRSNRKMVKIDFNTNLYIESLSDYVKIFTPKKIIITRETISNLEEKLFNKKFIRIHRSYIVSIQKITSYTNEFVEIDKKALPISRSYKESVLQKLTEV